MDRVGLESEWTNMYCGLSLRKWKSFDVALLELDADAFMRLMLCGSM